MLENNTYIGVVYYSMSFMTYASFFLFMAAGLSIAIFHDYKQSMVVFRKLFILPSILLFLIILCLFVRYFAIKNVFEGTANMLSTDNVIVKVDGVVAGKKFVEDILSGFKNGFEGKAKGSHEINRIYLDIELDAEKTRYRLGRDSRNKDLYWVSAYFDGNITDIGFIKLTTKPEEAMK